MLANMSVNFHEIWRWSPRKFLLIWLISNGMTHQPVTNQSLISVSQSSFDYWAVL